MIQTVPVETAKKELDALLQRLALGDTVTLTSTDGRPVAVLVSLESTSAISTSNWQDRWDALTEKVSRAWTSDKSAIETLREMRR